MNELIKVGATINSKSTITSLELVKQVNLFRQQEGDRAELRHDTLRDIIKDEFSEEILSQEIVEKPISSNGGRPSLVFELTLSQAKQVLLRESKFVRKAVIAYINKLESMVKVPKTFKEALILAVEQQEIIERQQLMLEEQKPKLLYYDKILASSEPITISAIANDYGISGQAMNQKLHELKVQYKQSNLWFPYIEYASKGYTKTTTTSYDKKDGTTGTNMLTKWTQKGRLFLYELLKNNGILPLIEQ